MEKIALCPSLLDFVEKFESLSVRSQIPLKDCQFKETVGFF